MMNAIKIALTGMTAATKRVNTSASNIVNMATTSTPEVGTGKVTDGYFAQRTINEPSKNGGVVAKNSPQNPSHTLLYDPTSPQANTEGQVAFPNVSLAEEMVQLTLAKHAYKANVNVMRTAFEMEKSMLDKFKA